MVDWITARPFVRFNFRDLVASDGSLEELATADKISNLLANTLISFRVEGTVRGLGTFEADFYDPSMVLLEYYLFDKAFAKYETTRLSPETAPKLQFGWITNEGDIEGSDWIPFLLQDYVPKINEGGLSINIKGKLIAGGDILFSKPTIRQHYRGNRDVSEIVKEILDNIRFRKDKRIILPIGVKVDERIQETNETYMDFIRDKLLFVPKGKTQTVCFIDAKGFFHFHPIDAVTQEPIKMVFPRTIEDVLSYDLKADKGISALMGAGQQQTCGFNAYTGAPQFAYVGTESTSINATIATPYRLLSEVEGFGSERWSKVRNSTLEAEIVIVGNPNIWQGTVIEMFTPIALPNSTLPVKHPYYSRTWTVMGVTHNIGSDGFTTTLNVVQIATPKSTTETGIEVETIEAIYGSTSQAIETMYGGTSQKTIQTTLG